MNVHDGGVITDNRYHTVFRSNIINHVTRGYTMVIGSTWFKKTKSEVSNIEIRWVYNVN